MTLGIALLAAGASRRMAGRDKLLETVGGAPLLRLVARRCLATGLPVRVTLPPDATARRGALAGLDVATVTVPDAASGMAASFRALAGCGDLMVVLADMPEIDTADLMALAAAFDGNRPVRATTADGRPGQPVILPARLTERFDELDGDAGARGLLDGEDVVPCPLPGQRAVTDLDTPDAWAAWRRRTGHMR